MKEERRKNPFAQLNKVDVSKYVEKKGKLITCLGHMQ